METGLVSNTPAATSTTTGAKKELDKDSFLQLLVAQLKSQDPTAAADPNAMVQQMTSFSALEQAQNTNTLLTSMQAQNNMIIQTQTVGLVGKSVETTSPQFDLKGGASTLKVTLASQADVVVTIKDANGKTVATLNKGTLPVGTSSVGWNGKDADGATLPDGTYTASVSGTALGGSAATASLSSMVKVDSVQFTTDGVCITAGGRQIALSSVTQIYA